MLRLWVPTLKRSTQTANTQWCRKRTARGSLGGSCGWSITKPNSVRKMEPALTLHCHKQHSFGIHHHNQTLAGSWGCWSEKRYWQTPGKPFTFFFERPNREICIDMKFLIHIQHICYLNEVHDQNNLAQLLENVSINNLLEVFNSVPQLSLW